MAEALDAVGRRPMSYRELSMMDVKELLRRWAAGQSERHIGRDTGADRKTVSRYIAAAEELGLLRESEVSDEQVAEVGRRVQARSVVDPSEAWREVAAQRERIASWLSGWPEQTGEPGQRPLRLSKIHKLLVRDHGLKASYDTLRRFAMAELGFGRKVATIRLDDPPAGQEAQVDFGRMGRIMDPATGRLRMLWALVVTLSLSRYQFVWPTFAQTTTAVCEGLDHAWWFFGAMVRTIVPDNTRAMIKDPSALSPTLVAAFLDYVQARGLFVDPARVRSPRDKARVENQVPYVRESWFDGETFDGLDDARQSATRWCRDEAGQRVHGTTRKIPAEVFATIEKPAMLPPPTTRYDVPLWVDKAKVHADHHIQVARALYSVPTRYLHKTVRARADQSSVKIYYGTELIKVHPRKPPGDRSTDTADYPVGKADYALRSVDALVAKAKSKGEHIAEYAERLLAGPLPWTRMRQAYALLRLCDRYGDGRVEAVCQSALAFDVIDVVRIGRMLKTAMKPPVVTGPERKVVPLQPPRFARSEQHFQTRPDSTTGKKEGR